jgi:transcription elongation factor GreA
MNDDIEARKQILKDELEHLKFEFKVELPKRIAEARAYGDIRENAEYESAKDRQAFVQARITQLSNQISQLGNLNVADIQKDKIGYGSTVTVFDLDDEENLTFIFVSTSEVKPSEGKISLSSPVGMALQNRVPGDIVEINIPAGKRRYRIDKIVTIHGDTFEHHS